MNVQDSLKAKLNPQRFQQMSSKMAALVGFILNEEFTSPAIAEVSITSDGYVLAREGDDIGANAFLGAYADLESNFRRLVDVAGLTPEEAEEFSRLYREHVGRVLN
ncbi:hypothetical protein F6X40_17425 [Paraburkholderia sp. UCT31]|uniref:hypothetical protein n=1 Tax=Paraburkholderia sp. UCT31 TaxID=2615209 RepID=UPI0016564384|nr:hypothetical protein [Paraburkholderia sp. UCT31]MBC8738543.1 hypothetical protein [Paraburkholderia sp. UCT31]